MEGRKMSFLQELVECLNNKEVQFDDSPDSPVEEGERVLGEMSEYLRRLYILYDAAYRESQKTSKTGIVSLLSAILDDENPAEIGSVMKNAMEPAAFANKKYETLNSFFWFAIASEFPETLNRACGVRRGWKVVTLEETTEKE